jgi:predicted permease
MRELLSKLGKLITGRRGLADDLGEEMGAHLEFEVQDNISRGMPPEHARQLALRRFGNPTLIHERARETWTFHLVETILQDLRYGLRMLARSPVLTFTAVLSLALGIGANTALFSVLNAVMLRLLPVQQPEQLMLFTWSAKSWPGRFVESVEGSVDRNKQSGLMTSSSFSAASYESLSRNNSVFLSVVASSSNDARVNVGIDGLADAVMMQAVSGNYFDVLGVPAVVGRTLQPADDRAEALPAAVLSHSYWQRRFGADESVAGKVIVLNGAPITIVGVAAREFFGVEPGRSPDLFVPLSFQVEQYRRIYEYDLQQQSVWWLTLIGRLKPGTGIQQAKTELATLFQRELTGTGTPVSENAALPWLELTEASRGLGTLREEYSASLFLLMAIVALVLLIACANVSGLLLSRASARQKEIALRLSLGAPRMRIVRQLLTESVALGLVGGTVGLLFASWISTAISVLFVGAPREPIMLSVRPDANVFAFTAAISIASGVLFGLAPALRGSRMDVYSGLRLSAGTAAPQGRGLLSGRILVVGQVALCLPVLIAAGLLVQTLQHLQRVDLGFDRHHLLLFDVQPGLNGYKSAPLAGYYSELEHRIRAIPGVKSVGMSQIGPIGEGGS